MFRYDSYAFNLKQKGKTMKLLKLVFAGFVALSFMSSVAMADPVKGQKYYLKTMSKQTGLKGDKFAALHTQAEWEKLFADEGAGFVKEMSEKFPALADFFNSDNFKTKILPELKDFCMHFASDSGNVPSC